MSTSKTANKSLDNTPPNTDTGIRPKMPKYHKLSVIIPAYNKDTEVFKVVSCYVDLLKHQIYDWEIIVVDDASCDHTLREAVRSKKFNGNTQRIKIFSYNLNQGKGFALYYGFKKSSGDVVAFADSDLDLNPNNLPILLNQFESTDSDIVIGSKRHPESQVSYPFSRRFMSKTYQILAGMLFKLNLSDTQVGIKVFKREVLTESLPRVVVKKYAFDLELLVVTNMLGYNKITEAPVKLDYNFSSTINLGSIVAILRDTFAIFYRKNFLKYYQKPHYYLENDGNIITPIKAFT